MKKINYIIVLLISLFMFGSSVFAKSVAKVCDYNNVGNPTSQSAVTIKIYDDGSADAIVTMANNKTTNNNENIQNWSSIKGTYSSKKTCPTHVSIYDNGALSNTKVWAYYSESEAISDSTKNKSTILTPSKSGATASENEKNSVISRIGEISNYCNSIAATNFDMNSCKDTSEITTRFEKCKSDANSKSSIIGNYISEVNGYVSKGYISASDDKYTTVNKVCKQAQDNVDEYKEALTYISNKEYNDEMGTDIPSSVSRKDVEDNKYVTGYINGSGPEGREIDTNGEEFFKVCDASTNPQLVASLRLIGIFITVIKILVPIILIIMGSLDMSKAVVSHDQDAIQKSLITFLKRAIAGILVFMAPSVILGIFHLVDGMDNFDSNYKTCVDCILGDSSCPNAKFIQGD